MRFDWWTFGLQTINVLVLVWLLSRFLFKPAAAIIAARQAEATKMLDEAAAARAGVEAEMRKGAAIAAEIADGRAAAMRAAENEANARKESLLAEARAEADRLREAAKREIAQARASEDAAASDRASRLAVEIAARLMDHLPGDARISGFIEGLATAVAALPAETRADLGRNGAAQVRAARPLTEAERRMLAEKLGQALGRPVEPDVVVDGDLIAGLEIETAHAIVRNSLRADLDRIERSLRDDGHG